MALTDEELGIIPSGGITANPISGGLISPEDAALGITSVGAFTSAQDASFGITDQGGVIESFGGELGRGLVRGFFNVGGGLVGTTEWLIPGKQESLIEAKRKIESAKADYSQEYGNWAGWAGRILGEAFPYMGAALVGGYAGAAIGGAVAAGGAKIGALAGAASVGFAVEGQNAYDEAITTGASEDEANTERLIVGTINAAIEAAQISSIMRFHKTGAGSLRSFIRNVRNRTWDLVGGDAKQFGGQVLKHALEEGLEEALQEGVSIGVPAALRGQVPRKPNGMVDWSQILNRVGSSAAAGALAGGVLGAGGALVGASPEIGRPSNKEIDKAIAAVDAYNIPTKEKELWKAQLEEHRIDLRSGETVVEGSVKIGGTNVKPTVIPEDQIVTDKNFGTIEVPNLPSVKKGHLRLYRGQSVGPREGAGTFYTPFLQHANEYAKYRTKEYGGPSEITYIDLPHDTANRYAASRINEEYLGINNVALEYIFPQLGQDTAKTPEGEIPALNRQWDTHLIQSIKNIDTSFREEHRAQIKKEKGIRIAGAEKTLKDENIHPDIRAAAARSQLAGELGLRFSQMKFDENQISYYKQRVLTAPLDTFETLNADEGLNALFVPDESGNIKLPEPNQIAALEQVFGPEFAKALHDLRAESHTLSKKIIDAANLPRAVLASFDMSAAGRQGLMLLPIAPKQWLKAVGRGYRAWTSPEYASYNELQIKSDPFYKTFKKSGGFLSEMGSVIKGEEVFISELAHRIPGIPASERAYVTTLNALRFYTFKKYAQQWQGTGKSHADYVLLAKFINHTTGRGSVKGLEEFMPALNALFFAPRLTMGRIQALGDLFKGATGDIKTGKFSPARKIIAQDLLMFFMGGVGILGLLSLMKGVDVEDDPRSSDFGKVRFGNTRFDFWGGYSQIARLVAQLITAEAKGTATGRIMPADRGQIIWRFVQSKLSPASGMSVDLIRGENFIGEKLEATPEGITKQAFERFTPLFVQDVVDAARYQGLTTAGIVAPLAMHGIGAMTYPVRPNTEASRIKDMKSREAYGIGWDEIGPLAQSYIRERNPDIALLERQGRSERENFDMVARRLEEQHRVTKDIIKKLPVPIRNDIDQLDVIIPGLSRYVSNGWYLNDARYKTYQDEIRKGLAQYLTRLRSRPLWNRMSDTMKATLIEDIASLVRDQVRSKLLMNSQIEDFRRMVR